MRYCVRLLKYSGGIIRSTISADWQRRRSWSVSESLSPAPCCFSFNPVMRLSEADHPFRETGVINLQPATFNLQPILLAGPTAVGKSEIAMLLAEKIGGEIISVDSMQVYRGLDIGTAKPSAADRARVPHHLIDVLDLSEAFDAAKFAEL